MGACVRCSAIGCSPGRASRWRCPSHRPTRLQTRSSSLVITIRAHYFSHALFSGYREEGVAMGRKYISTLSRGVDGNRPFASWQLKRCVTSHSSLLLHLRGRRGRRLPWQGGIGYPDKQSVSVHACMREEKTSQSGEVSVSYSGLRGIACADAGVSTGGSGDFTANTVCSTGSGKSREHSCCQPFPQLLICWYIFLPNG